MPNEAYVCEEFAAWERDAAFARTWCCIGTARPVEFAGLPLIVLRDLGGTLRAFHNVCSHRGMVLMDRPARTRGAIRCLAHCFHRWIVTMLTQARRRSVRHAAGAGSRPLRRH